MELTGGGGSPLLRVTGLLKRYPSFELRDVSLEVPAGRIVGFVGRNGAGKTTTLRCVTGAARADAGTVEVLGGARRRAGTARGATWASCSAGRSTTRPRRSPPLQA